MLSLIHICIPSVSAQSDYRPEMTRCAEWLAAALRKAGADRAEVMTTEGNPVAYAEKIVDPKAKTVLVYGHYDAYFGWIIGQTPS